VLIETPQGRQPYGDALAAANADLPDG